MALRDLQVDHMFDSSQIHRINLQIEPDLSLRELLRLVHLLTLILHVFGKVRTRFRTLLLPLDQTIRQLREEDAFQAILLIWIGLGLLLTLY